MDKEKDSYYAALYAKGNTDEYCLQLDKNNWITGVEVGGTDAWYMAGHVFFNADFSERFKSIFLEAYKKEERAKTARKVLRICIKVPFEGGENEVKMGR